MDAIRSALLEVADSASVAVLNAGKAFGFLEDGRDLIEEVNVEGGLVARLRDHADEGWPEVEIPLPAGSMFRYALAAPLSRAAMWSVSGTETGVRQEIEARARNARFEPGSRGGFKALLGTGIRLAVMSGREGEVLLTVKQVREPDAIADVLRNRATKRPG